MRTVYLNGDYLPENEAMVSIFDRGFLMADGVYEVTSVLDGKLIDFAGHMARLKRSLGELDMINPLGDAEWLDIHRQLVRVNEVQSGGVPGNDPRDCGSVHPVQAGADRQRAGKNRDQGNLG